MELRRSLSTSSRFAVYNRVAVPSFPFVEYLWGTTANGSTFSAVPWCPSWTADSRGCVFFGVLVLWRVTPWSDLRGLLCESVDRLRGVQNSPGDCRQQVRENHEAGKELQLSEPVHKWAGDYWVQIGLINCCINYCSVLILFVIMKVNKWAVQSVWVREARVAASGNDTDVIVFWVVPTEPQGNANDQGLRTRSVAVSARETRLLGITVVVMIRGVSLFFLLCPDGRDYSVAVFLRYFHFD